MQQWAEPQQQELVGKTKVAAAVVAVVGRIKRELGSTLAPTFATLPLPPPLPQLGSVVATQRPQLVQVGQALQAQLWRPAEQEQEEEEEGETNCRSTIVPRNCSTEGGKELRRSTNYSPRPKPAGKIETETERGRVGEDIHPGPSRDRHQLPEEEKGRPCMPNRRGMLHPLLGQGAGLRKWAELVLRLRSVRAHQTTQQ